MTYSRVVHRANMPSIYFVFMEDLIYIGETQSFVGKRWSDHVSGRSRFIALAREHREGLDPSVCDVRFFGIHCSAILDEFPTEQLKTATQAVEHAVHCEVLARPSQLPGRYTIISDTEKTAPRRFRRWEIARAFAKDVVEELCLALRVGKVQ